VAEPFAPAPPGTARSDCARRNPSEIPTWPALFMSASAAIANPLLRRAFSRRARPSGPHRIAQVRIESLGLHAPRNGSGTASFLRCAAHPAVKQKLPPPLFPLHRLPWKISLIGFASQSSTIDLADPTQLPILSKNSYVFPSWLSHQLPQSASL
jgi:hypothetical protein